MAQKFRDNPYLQKRGYPGTHDLGLALEVLSDLKNGANTNVPIFDKSLKQGQGDRLSADLWHKVKTKKDVIIFDLTGVLLHPSKRFIFSEVGTWELFKYCIFNI